MIIVKNFISQTLVVVVTVMCFNAAFGHPVSFRGFASGGPVEMTTTPKKVLDNFQLKKQVLPIPQNESKKPVPNTSNFSAKLKSNDIAYEPVTYKIKPAILEDKPPKQSDDDDDDDDDGGEYDGATDYASCKKKEEENPQGKSKSMPMMIIRQLDVMAMDIPIPTGKKDSKKPCDDDRTQHPIAPLNLLDRFSHTEEVPKDVKDTDSCETKNPGRRDRTEINKDKSWGEWSSCSKSCGGGVQTRSRVRPLGNPDRDIQVRTCNLAECRSDPRISGSYRMLPSQYKYRELSTH